MTSALLRLAILAFLVVLYAETFGSILDWPDWKTDLIRRLIAYSSGFILWPWIMEKWNDD